MRVLSIAVNTATCERLFSELGIIHTAKRSRLASDKTLDIQTVAQHVRQRALKHEKTNSKKKLLVCPDERVIVRDTLVGMFTPPPPVVVERNAGSEGADGGDDDPGDGADGEETMALWTEYLDEDEELDTGYEEAHSTLNQHVEDDADEFKTIALPVLHEFPTYNPSGKKLTGFRGQKVTLVELFG
ncbi:hypothetical protein DVH05_001628 [Phytophthora capsici]|nr:hypothetical protein DVH05_001628 [Phytophthora capsici]